MGSRAERSTSAGYSGATASGRAAAARCGLSCVLLLRGAEGAEVQGNLLLDHLFGAEVRPVQPTHLSGIWELVAQTAAELQAQGRRAYAITTFEALGGVAYVQATCELDAQCAALGLQPTWLVTAAAGGTQAGLVLGAKAVGAPWRVWGVAPIVWPEQSMREIIATLARSTSALLGLDVDVTPDDIMSSDAYVGPGYAVSTPDSLAALTLMARTEGILLDPVYTAKALAGLIDQVQRGVIGRDDAVIFLHTGGTPALFARAPEMASAVAGPTPRGATSPA